MAGVRHYEQLDCWQLARELKLALYRLAQRPDVTSDLRFRDQLRDSAASAPANIAEGFGRRTQADFARFLDVARGSIHECENHIGDARDRGYLTPDEHQALLVLVRRTLGAIGGLQRHLRRRL